MTAIVFKDEKLGEFDGKKTLFVCLLVSFLLSVTYVFVKFVDTDVEDAAYDTIGNIRESQTKQWNLLLFVQQWPASYCSQWKEKNSNNSCSFPPDNSSWTIHGIWPTANHSTGPCFCHDGPPFNKTQLDPLKDDLLRFWTEIEAHHSPYEFWKHEWVKHGRCAAQIPALNDTGAYFRQGLAWIASYNARDLLSASALLPGNDIAGRPINAYWNALVKVLGKNPVLQCERDERTDKYALLSIGICFGRDLKLWDCDETVNNKRGDMNLRNCPLDEDVLYPIES